VLILTKDPLSIATAYKAPVLSIANPLKKEVDETALPI
jgi:hypothetical protein